jgi:hypothetical protein
MQIEIFFANIFFVMFNEMRKILFDQFNIRPTMSAFIGSRKTIPALVVASVAEEQFYPKTIFFLVALYSD